MSDYYVLLSAVVDVAFKATHGYTSICHMPFLFNGYEAFSDVFSQNVVQLQNDVRYFLKGVKTVKKMTESRGTLGRMLHVDMVPHVSYTCVLFSATSASWVKTFIELLKKLRNQTG